MSSPQPPPGDRLERALAAYLASPPSTRGESDALLARNPDLAELLTPMVDGDAPAAPPVGDGERVLGDFRLVRELGRGGMGVVHEAWQRSLDRRVAVKVLAQPLVANASAVARFRREATAAGRLRHPHIVEVLGFGSDGGEHFFAMQYVDGRPLHDVAERFRSPAAAVELAAQVAEALVHAHAASLVHRDVKPGNVLVRADGHTLLTDFGVARDDALPSLTHDGGFVGTLDYASPEQVRGEQVDARTDVWALGVILHELVSGAHPFSGSTQQATLHRILTAEPPRLQGQPGISDDLAAVVDRALAKDRTRRYVSAAAMLADLRALQRREPVSARLPTGIERARRWAAREPWRAFAAAVLLLAVPAVTATVGYLWANADRIEAATTAEARARREDLLSRALVASHDEEDRAGLAAGIALLDTLPVGDVEAAICRALMLLQLDRTADAHAALQGTSGPIVDLMHEYIDRPVVKIDQLDELPGNAFECFVRAAILYTSARHRGSGSRQTVRRSLEMTHLAVALAPTPRLAYLTMLAATARADEDRVTEAAAALALETHFPDAAAGLEARALAHEQRRPELALELCERLIVQHPDVLRFRRLRARALEQQKRLDDAAAANREILATNPDDGTSWSNLSAVLRKQKKAADAVAASRRATELSPTHAWHWNLLALALRDDGKPAEAEAALRKALELRPDYAAAAYQLGNLLQRRGDSDGAITAFRQAIASDPDYLFANANLADALGKAGRHDEALPYAMHASELAPGDLIPNFNVASLALKLGLPRLALDYAQRALRAAKDDPNALEVHAKALLAQDVVDVVSARKALEQARAADGRRKDRKLELRLLIASAMAATGDRDGAVELLEDARAEPRFAKDADREKIDEQLAKLRAPK